MQSVHLVISDLFLPKDFAAEACAGLSVPALEKMLGRGHSENLEPASLEDLLCESFGVPYDGDAPIAPISAAFDGLDAGCWLRADPVHLHLRRDQMLLLPVMEIGADEAGEICSSLNRHFAGQGMEFFAPHAQRWYVRLDALPRIRTTPLSQVVGSDVRNVLPSGEDAAHWHRVFNEVQMLMHAHPLNEVRDARGALAINSVWFWGGGCDSAYGSLHSSGEPVGLPLAGALLQKNYDRVSSDDVSAGMFATSSGAIFSVWPEKWRDADNNGRQLLVWTGLRAALLDGNLGAWRAALQDFEYGHLRPIWQALRSGSVASLRIDILGRDGMQRVLLTPRDAWAFWKRSTRLAECSMV